MTAVSTTGSKTASANADPITTLVNTIQGYFEGATLLVRRSFFNEAPTVSPVQITGQTTGAITGSVNATDPEGDHLVYKVTQQAHYGTVAVDAQRQLHLHPDARRPMRQHLHRLLHRRRDRHRAAHQSAQLVPGRPAPRPPAPSTRNPPAPRGSRSPSSTDPGRSSGRARLGPSWQATAIYLSSYFVPEHTVDVTYKVTGQYSLMGGTLASAGSDLISSDPGFYDTVVQNKILTGVDSNGAAADGTITWNFGYAWGYNTVAGGQYDFQSTAMHELLHTFGFISVVDSAGNNTDPNWTTFDSFIVTSNGTSAFTGSTWKTAYNSNLTGGNGGLYFGGANAVAAYGGNLVPLYTPNPWESGSSMSHLDDNTFYGSIEKLMNAASDTGLGVRTLSAVEIGIMKDLGYTMVSQSTGAAVLFIGLMLVRRRRR